MTRPFLTPRQARRLCQLVSRYKGNVREGKPWNKRTDDELWLKVLAQVVVVGKAQAGYVLEGSYEARRQASFRRLRRIRTEAALRRHLHWVLRGIGTRYVGKGWKENKKAASAAKNFQTLEAAGGPRRFFKAVAGHKSERERIQYLRRQLRYIKDKGARDTLIELHLARNCVALDVRVQRLMQMLGCRISGPISRHYDQIERELIQRVAKPCGLTGAKLDRILFQNYDNILADIRLQRD